MSDDDATIPIDFTSNRRKMLLLEMAAGNGGVTPADVHRRALELGDTVTEEAYYNIARRLVHRGLLQLDESSSPARYCSNSSVESRWLEEDDLCALVDPDYPLLVLTVAHESSRQMNAVPEDVWVELRERLRLEPARALFARAIESYCDDFFHQVELLVKLEAANSRELPNARQECENSHRLLLQLTKHGLGLSQEAIDLPMNVDTALRAHKKGQKKPLVDRTLLADELCGRIADEPFIVDVPSMTSDRKWLIGAVDGSTRGGILSFLGEDGDFVVGHAPMVSINTAVGQVNRRHRVGKREQPVFIRLPEKPEDMQRQDNRYTIMAKVFHSDMSDAEYMHSVWNAMDLIEARAATRLLSGWTSQKDGLEVPGADVVLRDGAVSPQDRDFAHYCDISTYGKIVRESIKTNWQIAKSCKEDGQTVAGVVKTTQLAVFGPVINWFASNIASNEVGQLLAWPMQRMNLATDQEILTPLLSARRIADDQWLRSCAVLRPFHALTGFARSYSRSQGPSGPVLEQYARAMQSPDLTSQEKLHFWNELFRVDNDPYVKLLEQVAYASFFVGAMPRLDTDKRLPRLELVVTGSNRPDDIRDWTAIDAHRDRLLSALQQNGFDVAAEHTMFQRRTNLDILPRLLIQAHDTVKLWAADLLSRVQEYIGFYLARNVKTKGLAGAKVRPYTGNELKLLYATLKSERDQKAGDTGQATSSEPHLPKE
jgi:hypothetical protein